MAAKFTGKVSVTWLEHAGSDRNMKLNADFTFRDAAGLAWTAKKGAVIDGASIPQLFWTTFGSPFIGDYRRASVVHDYYCDVRTRTADATHHMFYEACRAGGVEEGTAQTMYAMVKIFGPSWKTLSGALSINGVEVLPEGAEVTVYRSMSVTEFSMLSKWIRETQPGIEAIDAEIELRALEMPVLPPRATEPEMAPM